MAIFRVYENGRPLQVKHYLPWSSTGARGGEAVFTSGHPAATQRLNTVAHLEMLRDTALPLSLEAHRRLRDAVAAYRRQGPEEQRQAQDLFFSLENSLKASAARR
jgi:Peptidase S46